VNVSAVDAGLTTIRGGRGAVVGGQPARSVSALNNDTTACRPWSLVLTNEGIAAAPTTELIDATGRNSVEFPSPPTALAGSRRLTAVAHRRWAPGTAADNQRSPDRRPMVNRTGDTAKPRRTSGNRPQRRLAAHGRTPRVNEAQRS
jgi:hypothetical protein